MDTSFLKIIYFDEAFVADFMQIIAGGELKRQQSLLRKLTLELRELQV